MTNRRRVSDNNNISQLLRDSFSVSLQPPIWEPPSHYSMDGRYMRFIHLMINDCSFISTMELTKVMSDLGERLSEEEVSSNIPF